MFLNAISALNGEIVYYRGHKVGSTTILAWMNLVDSSHLRTTHPDLYDTNHWSTNKERTRFYHKDKVELGKKDLVTLPKTHHTSVNGDVFHLPVIPSNNKVRFCVVRDPVERFISAFANRATREKEIQTIEDFINNFDYYFWKHQNIESHFAPLVFNYGLDPSLYTNIYNINQMSEIKKMLESYSGTLPDIAFNKTEDSVKQALSLTNDQVAFIKKKYAIDYEVFGKWL